MPLLAELLVAIAFICIGVRLKGVGIGSAAVFGVVVLTYCFHTPVAAPSVDVVLIVLAIVVASATLDAAGGIDVLVGWSETILRRYPKSVTFLAPLIAYIFTLFCGTGYVAFAILPVIAEVSSSAGTRPERPLSASVIASQMAITASPISAATAALVGLLASAHSVLGLRDILAICIPATVAGSLAGALSVAWRGPEVTMHLAEAGTSPSNNRLSKRSEASQRSSVISVCLFASTIIVIVALGLVPALRPMYAQNGMWHRLEMTQLIEMAMFSFVAACIVLSRCEVRSISLSPIMPAGIGAVISILGVTWLGNCFIGANQATILSGISEITNGRPWLFVIGLFGFSALLYSQAATVAAVMVLGFSLKIPHALLIAMFPAVNGFFVFPTSGTVVAAVDLDKSKTTRVGRAVLNHSFMLPGLVATIASVLVAWLIVRVFYN